MVQTLVCTMNTYRVASNELRESQKQILEQSSYLNEDAGSLLTTILYQSFEVLDLDDEKFLELQKEYNSKV